MESQTAVLRAATAADAENLLKIYAPYVRETAITFEYDVPSVEEFAGRIESVLKKYPYLVAQRGDEILGYAYAGSFHARPAYDWAVEVSIYVDRDKKRTGIGSMLYRALEATLREQGILNVNACIAYPEVEDEYLTRNSVGFHEHLGYRWVGEFRKCGYKFDRWYNMVWMEKHIGEHQSAQPAPKTFEEVRGIIREKYHIE
ncbi:GNAT family N-acetyltransferase [Feifania hominis]|uniref:GNAT family N-acetyltransferase n=1 Tax=Feifania hominis TaxID=2763660 RepID=A0A926HTW1_9FIRM|nr:GNAT family N-acetyltransferase [Feifania hominis]